MKPKSEKSIELYHIMTERGYPESEYGFYGTEDVMVFITL